MRVRAATVALMLATGTFAAAPAARAQCGKPDLVDMVPPDGATGVPRNAKLGAHYATSTEYLGEDVVLVHPDGSEQLLDATWDATEQFLSVVPSSSALTANSSYEIRWPVLRGLNAAAPGLGGKARFTTGAAFDTAPPTFAGVVGLSWDFERKTNDCIDETVERFVFDVDLGAADDDGGTSGLTLMLFQTRGPQVLGMPVPIPARAWPQSGTRTQVQADQGRRRGRDLLRGAGAGHPRPDLGGRRRPGLRPHHRPAVLQRLQRRGPRRRRRRRRCARVAAVAGRARCSGAGRARRRDMRRPAPKSIPRAAGRCRWRVASALLSVLACRAPAPDGAAPPPRARTARTWRCCASAGTADARAW